MTETKDPSSKKPLSLSKSFDVKKTAESTHVRQSFSHGRSKTVTVEVKKKRPSFAEIAKEEKKGPVVSVPLQDSKTITQLETVTKIKAAKESAEGNLTAKEWESRKKALQEAIKTENEKTPVSSQDRNLQEENRLAVEEQNRRQQQENDVEDVKPIAVAVTPSENSKEKSYQNGEEENEEEKTYKKSGVKTFADPRKNVPAVRRVAPRRSTGRVSLNQNFEEDTDGPVRSMASIKRARAKERQRIMNSEEPLKVSREVILPETITVQDLSNRMAIRGADVIKKFVQMGVMVTPNQVIDADTAELIVLEFGHIAKRVSAADVEIGLGGTVDTEDQKHVRPPVVTIMGHVDHGKTSLLDALRKTDVAAHEAGGITQHIGAYQITLKSGKKITFVDTPGHAAFTQMRARGANITDIVVLVVAADDGIMDQTIEAIHHAKAANVPIIVAINKIDKPSAQPDRIRQDLLSHDLIVESLSGDVLEVEVSAKNKINLEKLEEAILIQAEILELKANPNCSGEGRIIESRIEKGRGPMATVLIQRGTVKIGDIFVAGCEWGKVRALSDAHGWKLLEAGPSCPVEILGFNGTPLAGDDFHIVENEVRAKDIVSFRQQRQKDLKMAKSRLSLEQVLNKASATTKEVSVIIKGDVQGSCEAINSSLQKLSTDEVKVKVLHSAVGGINEGDVSLAKASNAIIIGFNVRANPQARDIAHRDAIDIRYYSIIYNVIDDLKNVMSGLLAPTTQEKWIGNATIREIFDIPKVGKIAGCIVSSGTVKRGAKLRLLRNNIVIHEGNLKTLKRFKDEVKEVKENYECGMAFENYQDLRVGDIIECCEIENIKRQL